ncbi:Cuticle protein 10.9 like protein [Argiope bruennichi]|uniref:Cuticle protein 10.9 like protein n=1 Tax=Argiope bruennichi TaxID=94029 RepID=A0A8T0FKH9_ARGBR|nr:Cuticle protein 10.9 like protein [Argiope bruennichi]
MEEVLAKSEKLNSSDEVSDCLSSNMLPFPFTQFACLLVLFILHTAAQNRFPHGISSIRTSVGRRSLSSNQSSTGKNGTPIKTLRVEKENEISNPYEFGYQMNDGNGTTQHRQEIRQENGDVKGSYGYIDPYGVYRKVEYYTDETGYHAKVSSNEPGLLNKNSANTIFVVENPPAAALLSRERPSVKNSKQVLTG